MWYGVWGMGYGVRGMGYGVCECRVFAMRGVKVEWRRVGLTQRQNKGLE